MGEQPILEVDGIEVVYDDAILAVRGVSLTVAEGGVVALLGANGAGKTTTLKAISNLLASEGGRVRQGVVRWRGEDTARLGPVDLVERGLVQVLEGRRVFPQLTVEDNLLTGGYLRRPSRRRLADDLERVYGWFPRLKTKRATRAGLTSGGEQQMVAIGRALMTRPSLVLLDEPSMGLAPIIVQEIFEIIRKLHEDEGVSFLLAEQNANLALRYADRAYVLENGRVAASGAATEILGDLESLYLGGAAESSRLSTLHAEDAGIQTGERPAAFGP